MPRLRHHADPGLYFPLKQQKFHKGHYPPVMDSIDWSAIFADGNPPAFIDIGCGMGKFMIDIADSNHDVNVLGFEVRSRAVEWINSVIDGEKIPNARALWYSVVNGMQFIKDNSIQKFFYLFPDPWVKKRHHKRRAFRSELLDEINRTLTADGIFYLMTDVEETANFELDIISSHGKFRAKQVSEKDWDLSITTNQEEFCKSKKIPYVRIICEKIKI